MSSALFFLNIKHVELPRVQTYGSINSNWYFEVTPNGVYLAMHDLDNDQHYLFRPTTLDFQNP